MVWQRTKNSINKVSSSSYSFSIEPYFTFCCAHDCILLLTKNRTFFFFFNLHVILWLYVFVCVSVNSHEHVIWWHKHTHTHETKNLLQYDTTSYLTQSNNPKQHKIIKNLVFHDDVLFIITSLNYVCIQYFLC